MRPYAIIRAWLLRAWLVRNYCYSKNLNAYVMFAILQGSKSETLMMSALSVGSSNYTTRHILSLRHFATCFPRSTSMPWICYTVARMLFDRLIMVDAMYVVNIGHCDLWSLMPPLWRRSVLSIARKKPAKIVKAITSQKTGFKALKQYCTRLNMPYCRQEQPQILAL
jgi:hypothetical protein